MRLGEREDARVQLSENDAEAVDRVDLGAEYCDLVDVLDQTLVAVLAIDVIEQPLQCLRTGLSGSYQRKGEDEGG